MAYARVAVTACTDFRTFAALTASRARVTCEMFFTLLMRSRISRAEAMLYAFQAFRNVSRAFISLARFSSRDDLLLRDVFANFRVCRVHIPQHLGLP